MNLNNIIASLSEELDLPKEVVSKVYKTFWLSIRQIIEELPLKEDLPEEEFSKLKTNFNLPSIGKLGCTYDNYCRQKQRQSYILKYKNNDQN